MPFDGIVTRCVAEELNRTIAGGRIEKIFQPEGDEIIINLRAGGRSMKLLLSASATYPRIHITGASRENPGTPPVFCMLLRKHLSGGKILGIQFHDYERIITLQIESMNELGDISTKNLIIEIMGRHSNIILLNSENKIIDAIKHIDSDISSVREVMPARPYVLPPSQDKTSIGALDIQAFIQQISNEKAVTVIEKYLLNRIKGFSPLLCLEICRRSDINEKFPVSDLGEEALHRLKKGLDEIKREIVSGSFKPCVIFADSSQKRPVDFHCLEIRQVPPENIRNLASISEVLDYFFCEKDRTERLTQKKSGLQRLLHTNLERCEKKKTLQEEKLREVADRETLRLYGELVTANIHAILPGSEKAAVQNYYSENGDFVEIPLDENLTPQQNAQRYFRRYAKAKSAFTSTTKQLEETLSELNYLESVQQLLEDGESIQDIEDIREELVDQGYLRRQKKDVKKKRDKMSAPHRFQSSDGLFIHVGRNNRQNDQLTMKTAASNDLWLHTRNIPGSHVIIKKQQGEIPQRTLLEAAMLAAWHSKAKTSSHVPVDYTTVRNVKKPPGAKPGMVIYENFKTVIVTPDEDSIHQMNKL